MGPVAVGGGAPISVQSMTITKTADVDGTLAQIYALAGAGADIVRCTCNDEEAAEGLARIVPRSPVPIVADIHFQYKLALAALEAGVQWLRLNPGNIRKPEHIKLVAEEAKARKVPIRIGVNAGSLDPELYKKHGGATPEALVESAQRELAYFAEVGFDDVKISVKASNVALMIEAYRQLADTVDYPLHLGVTEAGPPPHGLIKATAGMATLLSEGIGDTIRYSLTADPVEEARAGRQLLEALGLRERKGLDLIACPSCGRAEVDVIKVAQEAQAALDERNLPIQVAVMGCVVNGPGEARAPTSASPPGGAGVTCSSRARSSGSSPSPRWCPPWSKRPSAWWPRASRLDWQPPTPTPRPRPSATARSSSASRATTPTPSRRRSTSSANRRSFLGVDVEIRPVTADEWPEFVRAEHVPFGVQLSDAEMQVQAQRFGIFRTLAAFEQGRIVATAGDWDMELTVPGLTTVPAPGVTAVGVRPTHRRRGLLTALMRRQLDDIRGRGSRWPRSSRPRA